jgi:eukaryotic-like serine/threonine-protein kinase
LNILVILSIFLFGAIVFFLSPAQAQQFLTYEDPEGRFTIQHPPDWKPYPAENRFANVEVEFLKADTSIGRLLDLDVRIIPDIDEEIVSEFGLENFMEGATSDLTYEIPNYRLEEGIECDTYTLAGNQACSILYSRTLDYMSELEYAVMQVATVKGNNAYMLTYMATVNDFDQNLPIANQMISSFQVLGSSGEAIEDSENGEDNINIFN